MSFICLSLHQLTIFQWYLSSPAHPSPDGVIALWGQAGWLHSATNPNGKYFQEDRAMEKLRRVLSGQDDEEQGLTAQDSQMIC